MLVLHAQRQSTARVARGGGWPGEVPAAEAVPDVCWRDVLEGHGEARVLGKVHWWLRSVVL